MGDSQHAAAAALRSAGSSMRMPAAHDAGLQLRDTPWGGPADASAPTPFHTIYAFLPIAQAGRPPCSTFRVPPAERPAVLSRSQHAAPARVRQGGAAPAPDAWNQCIDRAEVCVLLRELAKLACGETCVAGSTAASRKHAISAMGHLIARFLTSHSPVRSPPPLPNTPLSLLMCQKPLFHSTLALTKPLRFTRGWHAAHTIVATASKAPSNAGKERKHPNGGRTHRLR